MLPKTCSPRHQYVVGYIFDVVGYMYPRYQHPKTSKTGKMYPTICTQDINHVPTTSKNVPKTCTQDMYPRHVPTGHSYDINLHSKTSIIKNLPKKSALVFDVVGNIFDTVGTFLISWGTYRGYNIDIVGTLFFLMSWGTCLGEHQFFDVLGNMSWGTSIF